MARSSPARPSFVSEIRQPITEKGLTAGRLLVNPPKEAEPREILLLLFVAYLSALAAVTLAPGYGVAYNNRGNAHFQLGRYDDALKDYQRATQLLPANAIPYNGRAQVQELLGRHGPMRSGRPTDPHILTALNQPTFVISGAQNWVQQLIRSMDVNLVGRSSCT